MESQNCLECLFRRLALFWLTGGFSLFFFLTSQLDISEEIILICWGPWCNSLLAKGSDISVSLEYLHSCQAVYTLGGLNAWSLLPPSDFPPESPIPQNLAYAVPSL